MRNQCTSKQKQDKSNYFRKIFSDIEVEHDSAKLHSTTKFILGGTGGGPPNCFQLDGKTYLKQKDIAEIQSKYYQDKVSNIKESLPRVNPDPLKTRKRHFNKWRPIGAKPKFILKSTTVPQVLKIISNLKNSRAFGRDKLDAASMKIAAPTLAPIICHLINFSLGTSNFPAKWKIARIIPVLKSKDADKLIPQSFRPISLLPLISKLTERTIQSQLLEYLEKSGQLSPLSHTYRSRTSTVTALLHLSDMITTATDENMITATMSVDQSAAFDCVDPVILMSKLSYYGLGQDTLQWINSYLSCRSGYVVIGSAQSSIRSTYYGVPQGVVMGPLLYLLYTNKLPYSVEDDLCGDLCHQTTEELFGLGCKDCGELPQFADDAVYVYTSKQINLNQQKIEDSFHRLKAFLNANGLLIN